MELAKIPKDKTNHYSALTYTVTVKPTCSSTGTETWSCKFCGSSGTNTLAKDPNNHSSWGAYLVKTPATCKDTGTKTRKCNGCGVTQDATIPVDKTNHTSWKDWIVTEEADCMYEGTKVRTCRGCGTTDIGKIPKDKSNHYSALLYETTKSATCMETGVEKWSCPACKAWGTNTIPIDKTNHAYWGEWKRVTEATCVRSGVEERTCRCGKTSQRTTGIDRTKHSWSSTPYYSEVATCEKAGVAKYKCQNLGCTEEDVKSTPINPNNHFADSTKNYKVEFVSKADCENPEYSMRYCSCGNYKVKIATASKLGHDYKYTVGSDCYNDTEHLLQCTRCTSSISEKHDLKVYNTNGEARNVYHVLRCTTCPYQRVEHHNYEGWEGIYTIKNYNVLTDQYVSYYKRTYGLCSVCGTQANSASYDFKTTKISTMMTGFDFLEKGFNDFILAALQDLFEGNAIVSLVLDGAEVAVESYEYAKVLIDAAGTSLTNITIIEQDPIITPSMTDLMNKTMWDSDVEWVVRSNPNLEMIPWEEVLSYNH